MRALSVPSDIEAVAPAFKCSRLLREAAGCCAARLKVDGSLIMAMLSKHELRLFEFMDACSLIHAHR